MNLSLCEFRDEMKEKKVRYKYAYNEQGDLVSIDDAQKGGGQYYCLECHDKMVPKKGECYAYHFAHKATECKYNNYLHTLAELLIQKWYNESTDIELSVPINETCVFFESCLFKKEGCIHVVNSPFHNLKKWYANCEREPNDTIAKYGFKPDLFLRDDANPKNCIFIEIAVTHPCELDKINSGIRIIEFVIESEDDIESIIKNNIIQANEKIQMYNFRGENKTRDIENNELSLSKFYLFPSKKVRADFHYKCHEKNENRGVFEIIVDGDEFALNTPKGHMFFDVAIAYACQFYGDLKHCNLCKYQKEDFYGNSICTLYKKYGTSRCCSDNNPSKCSYFRKDLALIKQRIEIFEEYKKEHPVLIWHK